MSLSTPKLPPSESRKGLLSSPKTLFGTPSTVNHQDRIDQSPEVGHRDHHDRSGSFGMVDTDTIGTGKTPTRSRFSTFASSFRPAAPHDIPQRTNDWEDDLKNLDRDQVLNPDYTRVGHISSVFQTNPMLNLYSDETANSTGVPLEGQSDPPGKGTEGTGAGGTGHTAGLGEEDEIDLRPPPSVHDEHVSSQKSSVERLRRRLESERVSISNPIPIHNLNVDSNLKSNSNSASAGGPQEVETNSSIAMQEQLAKIFDLQMRLADMHGEMEGIDEVVQDDLVGHDGDDNDGDNVDEVVEGVGHGKEKKEDLTSSPKKVVPRTPKSKSKSTNGRDAFSPKSPEKELDGKTEPPSKEEGEETDGVDQRGAKREMQIGEIVDKLSDLSTLLHQFHSMPHPNLDSAFPTSPASASSFAKQNMVFEAMSRRPTVGRGKAQGAA